jgi:glycosyltransferase involved in cell wall biosynthesis
VVSGIFGMDSPEAHWSRPGAEVDVAVIGIVGLPARYGGFETLADHLVRHLAGSCRMLVFCSSRGIAQPRPVRYRDAQLAYLDLQANGWQSIPYDMLAMWRAARRSRCLLVLGVSGCLLLPLLRWWAPAAKIVTNIDGLEWQRRKWGAAARWVLRTSEAFAVRHSDGVIADNEAIREYVSMRYGVESVLIPYGGDDLPDGPLPAGASVARFAPGSYFVSVCRIEPENNIEEILRGFEQVPSQPLVLVGNWQASDYGRSLRARFGDRANLQLHDPVYEPTALLALRRGARAYVHGHSAGGTNPSLVEAMGVGLPVLAFDVGYNRHTMGGDGLFWRDPSELARLLREVDPTRLSAEGRRLKAYADAHYTWRRVCEQYRAVLQRHGVSMDDRVAVRPQDAGETIGT